MTLKDENLQAIFDTIETYDLVRTSLGLLPLDEAREKGRESALQQTLKIKDIMTDENR